VKTRSNLLPISWTKVNRLASAHILHNILNAPGLVLIALGIVWLESSLICHVDTLLQALGAESVVLIGVGFGIVRPHPLGELGCGAARVELDFVPVGVLQKFGVGEAEFLSAGVADEAVLCELKERVSKMEWLTGIGCEPAQIEECSPYRQSASMKLLRWHPR
jgi:hypothetical protein